MGRIKSPFGLAGRAHRWADLGQVSSGRMTTAIRIRGFLALSPPKPNMARRRRLITALATFAIMSWATSSWALAGNWGADPTTSYYGTSVDWMSECSADDKWHYIFIEADVGSSVAGAIRMTMVDDYTIYIDDPIQPYWELRTTEVSTNTAADVVIKWDNYSNSKPYAYTTCMPNATQGASGWNKWCKRQQIWFDASDPYPCFSVGSCLGWVVCQETGHTLGLQHAGVNSGRNTCMKKNSRAGLSGSARSRTSDRLLSAPGHLCANARVRSVWGLR